MKRMLLHILGVIVWHSGSVHSSRSGAVSLLRGQASFHGEPVTTAATFVSDASKKSNITPIAGFCLKPDKTPACTTKNCCCWSTHGEVAHVAYPNAEEAATERKCWNPPTGFLYVKQPGAVRDDGMYAALDNDNVPKYTGRDLCCTIGSDDPQFYSMIPVVEGIVEDPVADQVPVVTPPPPTDADGKPLPAGVVFVKGRIKVKGPLPENFNEEFCKKVAEETGCKEEFCKVVETEEIVSETTAEAECVDSHPKNVCEFAAEKDLCSHFSEGCRRTCGKCSKTSSTAAAPAGAETSAAPTAATVATVVEVVFETEQYVVTLVEDEFKNPTSALASDPFIKGLLIVPPATTGPPLWMEDYQTAELEDAAQMHLKAAGEVSEAADAMVTSVQDLADVRTIQQNDPHYLAKLKNIAKMKKAITVWSTEHEKNLATLK